LRTENFFEEFVKIIQPKKNNKCKHHWVFNGNDTIKCTKCNEIKRI